MTHKFFLLAGCVALALFLAIAPPVAAQDNASNETTDEHFADIDGNAYVEDWHHTDGMYHVTVNSSDSTTVYAMPPLDSSDEGSGSLDVGTVDLEGDQARELTVRGDGEIVLMTETFLETGDHLRLSSGTGALIGDPDSHHLWITAIGTAAGLGGMTVIRVLMHMLGVGAKTERVA